MGVRTRRIAIYDYDDLEPGDQIVGRTGKGGLAVDRPVADSLPQAAGWYVAADSDPTQERLGSWHTDGWIFYYLNSDGNWVDIGWGEPSGDERLTVIRLLSEVGE